MRKTDLPLVSIITPSYNHGKFIQETIESVLSQDYPNLEYIVVDGGSIDQTLEILEKYSLQDSRFRFVSEPDHGQAHAVNKGIKMAKGEIIGWLNSDDLYLPGAIRNAVDGFKNNDSWGMLYGNCQYIDGNSKKIMMDFPLEIYNEFNDFFDHNIIGQPSAFFRKAALEAVGGLDDTLQYCMDYDLWIRLAKKFPLGFINYYLAIIRIHPEAKSVAHNLNLGFPEIIEIGNRYFGNVSNHWLYQFIYLAESKKVSPHWYVNLFKRYNVLGKMPKIKSLNRFEDLWVPPHLKVDIQIEMENPLKILLLKGINHLFKTLDVDVLVNGKLARGFSIKKGPFELHIPVFSNQSKCTVEIISKKQSYLSSPPGTIPDKRNISFLAEEVIPLSEREFQFYKEFQKGPYFACEWLYRHRKTNPESRKKFFALEENHKIITRRGRTNRNNYRRSNIRNTFRRNNIMINTSGRNNLGKKNQNTNRIIKNKSWKPNRNINPVLKYRLLKRNWKVNPIFRNKLKIKYRNINPIINIELRNRNGKIQPNLRNRFRKQKRNNISNLRNKWRKQNNNINLIIRNQLQRRNRTTNQIPRNKLQNRNRNIRPLIKYQLRNHGQYIKKFPQIKRVGQNRHLISRKKAMRKNRFSHHLLKKNKRIGINLIELWPGYIGGMEQYVIGLIEWASRFYKYEIFLFLNDYCMDAFQLRNEQVKKIKIDFGKNIDQQFNYWINQLKIDLWFCPLMSLIPEKVNIPSVVLIPDIQHEFFPEFFTPEILKMRKHKIKNAVTEANVVITISEFSKKTIIDKYKNTEGKLVTIYGDSPKEFVSFQKDDKIKEAIARKYKLPDSYGFMPANTWPHKNHLNLLKALLVLREKNNIKINIVMTGNKEVHRENFLNIQRFIEENSLANQVTFLNYVPQEEMPYLYLNSEFLVYPSLFEGFGIPLVEAMRTNTPIICSNTGSIPEVAGDASLFFNPNDPKDIAKKMLEVLQKETKNLLIEKGKKQLKKYSWDKSAMETLQVFDKLINNR